MHKFCLYINTGMSHSITIIVNWSMKGKNNQEANTNQGKKHIFIITVTYK